MSIRPIAYNDTTKIYTMYEEENNHTFDVLLSDIPYVPTIVSESVDHKFIAVRCLVPNCESTSYHPVGGGTAPSDVQTMFVRKTELNGCACGNIPASNNTLPEAHVRLNCNRMDGPGQWQASESSEVELYKAGLRENAPNMFQVVYRNSDNLILGLEPRAGAVGQGNGVAVIHDMNEFDILLETDPAYLSEDKDHIVAESPI